MEKEVVLWEKSFFFFFLSTVIAKFQLTDNSNVESTLVFKAIQLFIPRTLKTQSKC